MKKIKSFFKDVILSSIQRLIAGKPLGVSVEKKKMRMDICNVCPYRKSYGNLDICSECGCVIASKTSLAESKCPQGKW